MVPLKTTSESEQSDVGGTRPHQTGLIIGDEMLNVDPTTQYEMQRKKERIMMQSLRRKQQAEENKNKIDAEARRKREEEAKNEEEKLRKKEEEKIRREAILEQFKMKKEMEKMEEQGIRMPEPVSARPVPRMRPKGSANSGAMTPRQRPNTIHVDKNADVGDTLRSSRGNRGSSSNISALHRSESRNSLISNGGAGYSQTPASGVSIAGMGTNRRPSTTPTNQRPTAKGPSRRGSVTYISQENNAANRPPSGPSGIPTIQRHASSASAYGGRVRKHSNMSNFEDEPGNSF